VRPQVYHSHHEGQVKFRSATCASQRII